ncbi:Ig-like domain (group 3) [Gordonia malaquae]|uniref:Bacterial Ig-like domain-containing protein n=1 Tax=Gordonia malaquae NBRC 108250 TaxID=1223542 RepID=M3UUA5_GORML|nr:Ig-like domain-containing protein [Gordonia malaquae]GAC79007.1 hypothetical protein GM1_006_00020 [Gordonia malaquae NBRC 108250]SEB63150.1 Ig-like domain (group 3) [Gordonia malaquae]
MRLTTSRAVALVGGAALLAGTLGAAPASAGTSTTNFTNFCTASSILTVTKVVPAGVTITAPETVSPGEEFTYRVQPIAGSYPNSDSGATTTNISRLKADFAIPDNATFVSAEIVAGTGIGLDNVAPNVLRVNDSGAVDPAGSILRLSGNNQVIANGASNSTNSEGGIRVPKSKKNLDGSNNANGDTWYRLPAVDVTMKAGASGTITPTVRIAGAAGNNNTDQNWSTQLAKASLFGTQWAPTRCSPRDAAGSPLNAGGGPLATINIESAAPVDEDTTTTVSAPNTATKGDAVTLSATVAPNPGGGTVQFKVDGSNVGSAMSVSGGTASIQHTFNTTGSRQVTAVFSGATGFNGSTSSAKTVTVSDPTPIDIDTTTTVTAPGTATAGDAVTLSASVSPTPLGGTVQFKVDGDAVGAPKPVTAGSASIQHTFASAGAHQVTAVFSGSTGFGGSTSTAKTVTVSDPTPVDEDTTTTVSAPSTATKGDAVTLSATVAPNPGGGTVQFKIDGTNVGSPAAVTGGTASIQHTFTTTGSRQVTAVFSGSTGFNGSTSAAESVTVSDPTPTDEDTTTTVTSPGAAITGDAVTLSASVSPTPNGGTVQFKVDGANVGSPASVTGGTASIQHTFATAGSRQVTAVYSGAAGFNGSTSAAKTIVVSAPDPGDESTTLTVSAPSTAQKGVAVELKAALTPSGVNGGTVRFQVDGTDVGSPVTVVNGEATLQHTFATGGNHTVTATYSGTDGYSGSISGPKIVKVDGDGGTDGGNGSLDFGSLSMSAADVIRSIF